jgi:hypothetical protein
MMAYPLSTRAAHLPPQPLPFQAPSSAPRAPGFEPIVLRAVHEVVHDMLAPAAGPCATCHWATGDGRRFECHRLSASLQTLGAGCAHWEREPGAEG